jgi:hypothetical protein
LPIFRLDKVFSVGRDLKVFLNVQGGLTRGVVPDPKHHEKQVEKLRGRIREQRKSLKREREQRKEQADKLRNERRLNFKYRRKYNEQKIEIFRLKNRLNATNDSEEYARDILPYPHASGELETGVLPDFVVIGAMRCGTSKFYEFLTQHPNVERAAIKEVHYFDRSERFEKGIEWYRQCFPPPKWNDGRTSITGEATPSYLPNPLAPERMARVLPEARLIVLLRNPIDRAYSHYHLLVRRGEQNRHFEEVIEEELALLFNEANESSKYRNILARGIYVDQLLRWSKFFDDKQILVLKSEDFYRHTTGTMKLVQNFLDLPYRKLDLQPYKTKYSYEPMDSATRRQLEAYFAPHNQRLYEYLGVDFRW